MMSDQREVAAFIKHIPIQPPRNGVHLESIYLKLWQNFANKYPEEWLCIFTTPGHIRQRAASVAASFMTYMGCNGGASFTYEAERRLSSGGFFSEESAYLATWALHNERRGWMNHGLRAVEFILAREYPITAAFNSVDWNKVPTVTMDDLDVIESMVRWWSTSTAKLMRKLAAEQVKVIEHEEQLRRNLEGYAGQNGGSHSD